MPDKYYYLVASLPYIRFGNTPLITHQEFLDECAKWLNAGDFKKLSQININELNINPKDPGIIKEWKAFNRDFREKLTEERRLRKESPHEKYAPNPLLMEKEFEEKRWFFLEGKEAEHHFDLEFLLLYFLKLQISERLAVFQEEKGKDVFEALCRIESRQVTHV